MAMTLDDLANELRDVLGKADAGAVADRLCSVVSRALSDAAFVARHLPDRADGEPPRAVLYEDPELGFCICGHVHGGAAESGPHDHGSSWAIYGQATGETEMTDWRIVKPAEGTAAALVEPAQVYTLKPGDAHFYGVGAVHSPRRAGPTRNRGSRDDPVEFFVDECGGAGKLVPFLQLRQAQQERRATPVDCCISL